MFKVLARTFAVGVVMLAAAIPTTASAAGPGPGGGTSGQISIVISPTVTVSGKLILSGSATVTCPVLDEYPGGPPVSSPYQDGGVSLQEVVGNNIAHGGIYGWTTVCDGVSHTYSLIGTAYDRPFRKGDGVAQAFAGQLCGYDPSGAWNCYSGSAMQTVAFQAVH